METARRQAGTNAFRSDTPYRMGPTPVRHGSAVPDYAVVPQIRTPAPRTRPARRTQAQTVWFVFMVVAAFWCVVTGLVFLSGHAQVTREGYRRAQLRTALRRERDLAQQWRQRDAYARTPLSIEQKARDLGMIRADDRFTVTVGQQ